MQLHRNSLKLIRISLDLAILIFCFSVSYLLDIDLRDGYFSGNAEFLLLLLCVTWVITSRSGGLYDEFRSRDFSYELILILRNVVTQSITLIVVLFLIKEEKLSRMFLIHYSGSFTIVLILQKYLFRKVLNIYRKRGGNKSTVLMVGAGEIGWKFYESIEDNPHFGYRFLGFLDDDDTKKLAGEYLGKISELRHILEEVRVDDVLIALPNRATKKIKEVMDICSQYTTRVRIIPDYLKLLPSKSNCTVSMFGKYPVIALREERINEVHWRFFRRIIDIIFSLLLIITIFSWLFPIIIILIKLDSKGSAFFKQPRWGRNNKTFFAYKFRSMKVNARDFDEKGKFKQATKEDPRITKVGRILRKTNLDELPNFINVLIGDMSVVGPRPHAIPHNLELKGTVSYYMQRHLVKPGITGWAQVHGFRGETKELELMMKRVEYDLWYIENWSFMLDIQIVIMTIWQMAKGSPNAY
jgi:putative colanic acid biosysnthesis UDP-glucose lipid carrier transferase